MEVRFVLVRPRNPLNIGAVARVMANFGFSDLAAVSPYKPIWQEAVSAVGAKDLLRQAKVFKSVDLAVADCQLVLATTCARLRKVRQPAVASTAMSKIFSDWGKDNTKIAVLIGSEKTGLPKKMLERASYLVTIPTQPDCPSMNLSQAVAVMAYELSQLRQNMPTVADGLDEPIGFKHKQQLISESVNMFKRVGFLDHLPSEQKTKRLWNLFNQWGIRRRQAALISGLIRKIK